MTIGHGWLRLFTSQSNLLGLVLAATPCLELAAQVSGEQHASPQQLEWLRSHAVPVKTVRAGSGFEDLEPLKDLVGSARVVGLGEGTHGTREYFQAKHRLLEYLVTELGFSIFSIEANMPEAYALNDYVLGGEGNVDSLIGGMHFWTWNTEAVRDMVEWMRAYNAQSTAAGRSNRLQFTGFDMQSATLALRTVADFLETHDRDYLARRATDLARLSSFSPYGAPQGYGCATGQLPIETVRGKKLRFTGWVKTDRLTEGRACLWWRIDGPTPSIDNMANGGQTGTSDWRKLATETTVPEDAEAVYFGLLLTRTGTGWFDGLRIEVDGEAWTSPEFDLDFESDTPQGIVHADPVGGPPAAGYVCTLDSEVAKSGRQSLRLESRAADSKILTPRKALRITSHLLGHMESRRDAYATATGGQAADWAIQNARLIHQWAGLSRGRRGHRDASMASNVEWIAEQNPEARIVLWAHNGHLRDEPGWQGADLREHFGDDYLNLAFCSSAGEYYAMGRDRDFGAFPLAKPPAGSFEAVLEADGRPMLLIDLRTARADDPGSAWLTETRRFGGHIGAMEMDEHYFPTHLQSSFDLLLYIRNTTPARQLATPAK